MYLCRENDPYLLKFPVGVIMGEFETPQQALIAMNLALTDDIDHAMRLSGFKVPTTPHNQGSTELPPYCIMILCATHDFRQYFLYRLCLLGYWSSMVLPCTLFVMIETINHPNYSSSSDIPSYYRAYHTDMVYKVYTATIHIHRPGI